MLVTERLILRPWRDADIEPWVAMGADPRVMEFFPSLSTREQAEASAARMRAALERDGYGWWVAEHKPDGDFAGVIALMEVPFEAHFTPATEIGWRLRPEYWGRGLATEGARAALAFAFEQLGRAEIVAMTARLNLRSQRVMQRLGMTHDPVDDFDHPLIEAGHPIRPHVLYRVRRSMSI
jgi:ribosomal-protein-alanine N-acetyltransferase